MARTNTFQVFRSAEFDDTNDPTATLNYGEFAWNNAGEKLFIGQQTDSGGTVVKFHLSTTLDITAGTSLTGALAANDGTDNGLTLNVDAASATAAGAIELAIDTEVEGGTDTTRAVTAATLKAWAEDNTVAIAAGKLPALEGITVPASDVSLNSHKIVSLATPSADTDAATKGYVDSLAQGLDVKASVRLATTDELECVYANQPATTGIGATLTADADEVLTLDSVAVALSDRVLVKTQSGGSSTDAENGIYTLTTVGTASVKWVLTRATDFDENDEITASAFVFVEEGTTLKDTGWVAQTNDPITFSSNTFSGIGFTQFSGVGSYTAGSGLNLTGTQFGIANKGVTLARMNDMATASIIGRNTAGVGVPEVLSAATARTVIGVDASGTDNSTDVTLATVTANYLSISDQAITAGEVPVTLGGTGLATVTSNGVMYGAGTGDVGVTAEGATGTVLVGTTSGAPSWSASPTGLTIDCGTWAAVS